MQTQAVATQHTNSQLTLRQRLESPDFQAAVAKSLPKHLTPDRFIRVAVTAMMRTPKLAQCTQASFFNAMLTLSQLGLEPDGRRAHLIPYENRKMGTTECQLLIDYKGIVELVMRSGSVTCLHADVVCENDVFEYDRGELKQHKIDFRKPRGEVYAVYALARFKDGTEKAEVMTRDEVEAVRRRSRAANAGPWVTDWSEMSKKTVFKRMSKWLPLSSEYREAIEADDEEYRIAHAKPVSDAPSFVVPEDAVQVESNVASPNVVPIPVEKPEPSPVEKPVVEQPAPASPHAALAEAIAGVPFDDFRDFANIQWKQDISAYATLEELPTEFVERALKRPKDLAKCKLTFGSK